MTAPIVWLTGQPGSGKTTIAQALRAAGLVEFVVDGDDLRAVQPEGFDERGRHRNVARAQDIALYLANCGRRVAVALISPSREQREWLKAKTRVVEVFLHCAEDRGKQDYFSQHYEPPTENYLSLDTGTATVAECVRAIRAVVERPRATFVGRWQPLHRGHDWLFRQALDAGEPVQILVRDIPPDAKNPLTTEQTVAILRAAYAGRDVVVGTIADVSAIHYGRGVGYGIVEHEPPADIGAISATEIRRQIRAGEGGWRSMVVPGTEALIERALS